MCLFLKLRNQNQFTSQNKSGNRNWLWKWRMGDWNQSPIVENSKYNTINIIIFSKFTLNNIYIYMKDQSLSLNSLHWSFIQPNAITAKPHRGCQINHRFCHSWSNSCEEQLVASFVSVWVVLISSYLGFVSV